MSFYYETTPLPTPVSRFMHRLPAAFHTFESWVTLALEIVAPWGAFVGRRARHITAATFTAFQLINLATGNFGFFVYLSLVLHVALVDDDLLARFSVCRWPTRRLLPGAHSGLGALGRRVTAALAGCALVLALTEQAAQLCVSAPVLAELRARIAPLRLVNSDALFATVTRSRFEAIFEVDAGKGFRPLPMHYKPGPADQPLVWVAPHQPRVDFRLWFFGLRGQGPPPGYVRSLLSALCKRPNAVQPLFRPSLPRTPRAVRVRFESLRFSSRAAPPFWVVESQFEGPGFRCRAER